MEVKVARVNGGLLLYEKENPQTPGQPYTHTNHQLPPKPNGNTTEFTLSVQQREQILSRIGNETVSHICADMAQSSNIATTEAQSTNTHKFIKTAQVWANRKSTKDKNFMHDYKHKTFTTRETNEILDELMKDAARQQWGGTNEFMSSNLFKTMTEQIKVLEHNFTSEGGKDVVFFESNKITEVVRLAGLMFEGEDKGAIQFACDFTHIPGTDFVLGICGVDDFKHRLPKVERWLRKSWVEW